MPPFGRTAIAVAVLAGASLGAAPVQAATPPQVLVFDGRGNGHGVGLAQDGARAMAAAGSSAASILARFYPHTALRSSHGTVRVDVWEGRSATTTTVQLPYGGSASDGRTRLSLPAGAVVIVSVDARGYHLRTVTPQEHRAVKRAQRAQEEPTPADPTLEPTPEATPSDPASAPPPATPRATPTPTETATATTPSAPSRPAPTASARPATAFDSSQPVTLAGPLLTVPATGRTYRGKVTALRRSGFRLVNVIDVEDYLRGLGEVPASWPAAALQAQAVAARTYALRTTAAHAPLGYDLCDDDRCQVYLGVNAEHESTDAAAAATRGTVVMYGSGLAETFYSANAGGVTAGPLEGFGSSPLAYLPAGTPVPGDVAPWTKRYAPDLVAKQLGYPGRLSGLVATRRGASGRVTQLELRGSAGVRAVSGVVAARKLGLQSTLFTVSAGTGIGQTVSLQAFSLQLPPSQASEQPSPLLADTVPGPEIAPEVTPEPEAPLPASSLAGLSLLAQPIGLSDYAPPLALELFVVAGVWLAKRRLLLRRPPL